MVHVLSIAAALAEYFGHDRTILVAGRGVMTAGAFLRMYTLLLKYSIDPNKLADWKEYVEAECGPITESGGRISGYYAPTEFAGATSEAFATIDVGTMAEYEVYRAKLAENPRHKENAARLEASGVIRSVYRAIVQRVDPAA